MYFFGGLERNEIKDKGSNKSLALLLVIFTKKHSSPVSTSVHAVGATNIQYVYRLSIHR